MPPPRKSIETGTVMEVQHLDCDRLRREYINARPFPFVAIDGLLDLRFAEEVARAYPSFDHAAQQGRTFKSVNERKKIQITDAKFFPPAVARLNQALADPSFLSELSYITGIPDLLADKELVGGGIHMTGPGGRLDVHVDFNYLEDRKLYRRLNLLVYLNPIWEPQWGGHLQLWDKGVSSCRHAFAPCPNRCVIFETSDISFHGVTPIAAEAPFPRISFAAYYYTRQPPANWEGTVHSTVFKARPEERLRKYVFMPAEALHRRVRDSFHSLKRGAKKVISGVR
jgi:Rps23 Pro-64 3,4-dihydroxylase Tpa1-like proline 4-hydroxylase